MYNQQAIDDHLHLDNMHFHRHYFQRKTILNCYIDTETKYVCKNCLDMQFHYLSQLDLNLQNENRHSSFAKHVGAPRLLKFA